MNEQNRHDHIPNHHVVAVISGSEAGEGVALDLKREGFEQAVLFHGNEVADEVDAKGKHAGPISRLVKALEDHLSEQPNYLAQYQEEARAGNVVIAVPVHDRNQADDARAILERNGAHNVRYFSTFAVVDLTPDTNPSARSAESPESRSKN